MTRYSYHVAEELRLDLDGHAVGERVISLCNEAPDSAPILIAELDDWFPESATDLNVFDLTANVPVADAEVEDHHYSRRVRWAVPQIDIPPHSQYQFRIGYRRSYVAHAARGYFHVTVGLWKPATHPVLSVITRSESDRGSPHKDATAAHPWHFGTA